MRASARLCRATAFGAACMLWFPTIAVGQTVKAGVVTTLQGTATVARSSAPDPAPLKFKDDVFGRDHIVTGESSIVRILLGGKAVVTIRERSALTIHETPTTSTVEIDSGKIAVAVAKDRMRPGDSVQIRTPNAMAGIRGTVLIADVTPPARGRGDVTTRFTLLTGIVDVSQLDAGTGLPTGQPLTLHPLQAVTVSGHTPPGAVRTLSRSEATAIAAQYKVSIPAPPLPANTQVTEQQVELAVQHSAALTGGAGGARFDTRVSAGDEPGVSSGSVTSSTAGVSLTGGATTGSGGVGAGGSVSAGVGSISAGGTVGAGSISAGGTVGVGGGGISAGGTLGAGTIGAGATVGAGSGGISASGTVGVGGTGVGGSVTVGGGSTGTGSGPVGGILPRISLPKL
jgi:hypothetical protein